MSADDTIDDGMNGGGGKQLGHERALENDLRDHFTAGEHITVFVEAPPGQNGGDEAVAKTNRGVVKDATVFITPGSCTLHRADSVHCRIRDVEGDYVKALALYRLG